MPKKQNGMPFEIHSTPIKGKDGGKLLYVRPASGRKKSMEEINHECAVNHGMRDKELERTFDAFLNVAACWLAEGYRIETPLGVFYPRIGLRPGVEATAPEDINGRDVRFEGVGFQCSARFEKKVAEWLRNGFRLVATNESEMLMTDQQHLERALANSLKANDGYTTVNSFSFFSGLTDYGSRKQLKAWCEGANPKLMKTRMGRSDIYTEI